MPHACLLKQPTASLRYVTFADLITCRISTEFLKRKRTAPPVSLGTIIGKHISSFNDLSCNRISVILIFIRILLQMRFLMHNQVLLILFQCYNLNDFFLKRVNFCGKKVSIISRITLECHLPLGYFYSRNLLGNSFK